MRPFTLDIETRSLDPNMTMHAALEPWRLRQGKAEITSIDLIRPDGSLLQVVNDSDNWIDRVKHMLRELQNEVVYCHNTQFDVAWLLAQLAKDRCSSIPSEIANIQWRDSMLLTKWLVNGQLADNTHFSFSLVNLIKTFLPDHPRTAEFLEMKARGVIPGEDKAYWLERGTLDVIMTQALVEKLAPLLPVEQRVGIKTEFDCIVPVANSWIMGIKIDQNILGTLEPELQQERIGYAKALGVSEATFTSPKQLANLLYNVWGLPIIEKTPTGSPSTSADTLLWLEYKLRNMHNIEMADRVKMVLKAKNASTLLSKYVKTTYQALSHTGDGYIYGCPRIFGTYTGRFTYSNTTSSKDFEEDKTTKFKTGIALHQIPRKAKKVRQMLLPPDDHELYEADASGQESRLMAIRSGDPVMLKIFREGLNFHSQTGAAIIGMEYDDFEADRAKENGEGYFTEQRQLGKLTNLSCNYRIGGKSLSEKAFTKYDTFMEIGTGNHLVNTFNRTYKGVPQYWDDVVWESKQKGYVEVFGGRRYKLTDWGSKQWATESSAINVPIQGAGASMKEIAIKETFDKVPDALFALDLHDANFFYIKKGETQRVAKELDHVLNSIDYSKYWGFTPPIPLEYESDFGNNFADVK